MLWESKDNGRTWKAKKQITKRSELNHNYVRKVVNGKDPFKYFWGDGDPSAHSESHLYFGDSKGKVWQLPYTMDADSAKPKKGLRER